MAANLIRGFPILAGKHGDFLVGREGCCGDMRTPGRILPAARPQMELRSPWWCRVWPAPDRLLRGAYFLRFRRGLTSSRIGITIISWIGLVALPGPLCRPSPVYRCRRERRISIAGTGLHPQRLRRHAVEYSAGKVVMAISVSTEEEVRTATSEPAEAYRRRSAAREVEARSGWRGCISVMAMCVCCWRRSRWRWHGGHFARIGFRRGGWECRWRPSRW